MTADTVARAEATPDVEQPWAELGLKDDEYARIREILGRRPTVVRAGDVLGDVERALLVQEQQGPPAAVRREDPGVHRGHAARRHRRERRRRRRRAGLGGHLQGRVAQPPVLRRAVPGRGDRRRRHRPRHPVDGRAAGRRDGPAALRPARRPRHPPGAARRGRAASAATATASACRTSAARSSSTRRYLGNPLVNALCVGVVRARPDQARPRQRRRQPGRPLRRAAPAATASAASRCSRRRRSTPTAPAKRPSVQVGDPFMEKLLIECSPGALRRRPGRGHPGPRRRRAVLRDLRAGQRRRRRHAASGSTGCRCATRRCAPEEILMSESQERMCAVVDARQARRVPGDLREVGRHRHRDRRGRRRRPAAGSSWHGELVVDVPPRSVAHDGPVYDRPVRAPGRPGRAAGRLVVGARAPVDAATSCAPRCCALASSPNLADKAWVTDAVRPLRAGQHRARRSPRTPG